MTIVEEYNTILSIVNMTNRQKVSKDLEELNNINRTQSTFTEHFTQ